jgi:hypothetical protein
VLTLGRARFARSHSFYLSVTSGVILRFVGRDFIVGANNRAAKSYSSLDGYLMQLFSNKNERATLRCALGCACHAMNAYSIPK